MAEITNDGSYTCSTYGTLVRLTLHQIGTFTYVAVPRETVFGAGASP